LPSCAIHARPNDRLPESLAIVCHAVIFLRKHAADTAEEKDFLQSIQRLAVMPLVRRYRASAPAHSEKRLPL
jgi:hypothetical protein